jgi:uncharacterized membrane protein YcaP (DUF421 family)
MDPGRIAVRAAFAFLFLLAMVRLSGKRAVSQGTPFDFVLALIFGDLVDDLVWAEVSASTFIVATATLFVANLTSGVLTWRARVGEP